MKKNSNTNTTALVYKEIGRTPLEVVEQYKQNHPQYSELPIAYAGRLDPMAEGKLLLLVGDACRRREQYLGLDKEYMFEVLVGFESDTHDILGITKLSDPHVGNVDDLVESVIDNLRGKQTLPYPAFSSKTVFGKPLFLWALEERLDEIDIPSKDVEIYELEHVSSRTITKNQLEQQVKEKIAKVTVVNEPSKELGRDFRRKEVLGAWDSHLSGLEGETEFTVLQVRCICSSGTYMRVLAHLIGQDLGWGGLAWSINRTQIGTWDGAKIQPIEDC